MGLKFGQTKKFKSIFRFAVVLFYILHINYKDISVIFQFLFIKVLEFSNKPIFCVFIDFRECRDKLFLW